MNHAFSKGEVFDSGEKILIGMSMRGMLRFPQAGRYALKAFVNDGILLYLGGKLVLDEPKWNKEGDRYTITAAIDAEADAWYPLLIEYFQRKGTATLKLYWRTPRNEDFEIVPREAFGNIKAGDLENIRFFSITMECVTMRRHPHRCRNPSAVSWE